MVARLNVEVSSELAGANATDIEVIKAPIFLSMSVPTLMVTTAPPGRCSVMSWHAIRDSSRRFGFHAVVTGEVLGAYE